MCDRLKGKSVITSVWKEEDIFTSNFVFCHEQSKYKRMHEGLVLVFVTRTFELFNEALNLSLDVTKETCLDNREELWFAFNPYKLMIADSQESCY